MKMNRKLLFQLLLVQLFLLQISSVQAQITATLSGTIQDQQNSSIAAVNVTLTNPETGLVRQATTNSSGNFTLPLLPPGSYTISAKATGFAPVELQNIILNGNDNRSLNITLKTGDISESVTVTNESSLIEQSSTVSTVVDKNLIESMPLNGRSLQSLIALTPGVVTTPISGDSEGQFSVNGQRSNANYFSVDGVSGNFGASNTTIYGQSASGSVPAVGAGGTYTNLVSIDALQEFTVLTSTTSAQYGRSPGAQVLFTTRSGTNDFHGSLLNISVMIRPTPGISLTSKNRRCVITTLAELSADPLFYRDLVKARFFSGAVRIKLSSFSLTRDKGSFSRNQPSLL